MTLHVLIPCKSLAAGKSRLAPVLGPARRRALCADFLQRTFDLALALVPRTRCWLITGDRRAASLARARGIRVQHDPGGGLNPALRAGRDRIRRSSPDAGLLVLPIDLPHATTDALRTLVTQRADVALAPDRAGTGTNALFLGQRALWRFPFRFGPGSRTAHLAAARAATLKCAIYDDARLAFDVDQPADYRERWREAARQRRRAC